MQNFKSFGVKVLESKHGDLHLSDPSLNISLTIRADFFKAGADDARQFQEILEKLRAFYRNHRRARIERLKKQVQELYESGQSDKLDFLKQHKNIIRSLKDTTDEISPLQATMLRRWEVDLYFFNNPKPDGSNPNRTDRE